MYLDVSGFPKIITLEALINCIVNAGYPVIINQNMNLKMNILKLLNFIFYVQSTKYTWCHEVNLLTLKLIIMGIISEKNSDISQEKSRNLEYIVHHKIIILFVKSHS